MKTKIFLKPTNPNSLTILVTLNIKTEMIFSSERTWGSGYCHYWQYCIETENQTSSYAQVLVILLYSWDILEEPQQDIHHSFF